MSEHEGSEEGGEGLSVVTLHDNGMGLAWSCTCRATGAGASVLVRKAAQDHARQHLADRLAAVQAERDNSRRVSTMYQRQIKAMQRVDFASLMGYHAATGSDERKVGDEWVWGFDCECGEFVPDGECNEHLATALRAALANPSAAQRDAEVGARALREAADEWLSDPHARVMGPRDWLRARADALTTDEAEVPR